MTAESPQKSLLWIIIYFFAFTVTFSGIAAAVEKLPQLNIDVKETSVSGLSSGGFMAVQFQVAYSSTIKGAGIIAGGPYFCAQNELKKATTVCSCTAPPLPCEVRQRGTDVDKLAEITKQNADKGLIDPLSGLREQRIYLFSGTKDTLVPQAVMNDLENYYKRFVQAANIKYRKDIPAQHAIVTDSYGKKCDHLGSPFINNCGFDTAGELLAHIYGKLQPRNTGKLKGTLIEFDQSEFLQDPTAHSLDKTGWAYIPASCRKGERCRVHIAFHGCKQGYKTIGRKFIDYAGYNQWADTNNIIVLYPQVISKKFFGTLPSHMKDVNPFGCWNYWGYDDDPQYATKKGRQMMAVKAMIDRLASSGAK